MKKTTLLFFTLIFVNLIVSGQILQSDNFDALTIGNLGTDINGIIAGQNGWFTFADGVGQNSDFQIVNEGGSHGNVLQITGAANADDVHLASQGEFNTAWTSRTSGNDIIEVEYDFFTGPTTTSLGESDVLLFNNNYDIIAGFTFNFNTKEISGLALYDNLGNIAVYRFTLGTNPIILSPNTWHRVGFSFDKNTGQVTWKGPGFYGGIFGAAAGNDPFEVDFALFPYTGNTSSALIKIDALRTRAIDTENLLGINDMDNTLSSSIKLYPNPANDIINLSASNNLSLTKLEVIDINGRLIMSVPIENITKKKINISNLSNGLYLINIYSINGMVTKKIIKE